MGRTYTFDPWVVVGRTTIDGVAEDIADALGMATASHLAENVDAMIRDGATVKVGGRTVRPREWKRIDADFCLLDCDIVRRQSEIDIEEAAASFARMGEAIAEVEAEQCPECGPHGNRGRVVLAFSEVACTVCAGGVPGDAFGTVDGNGDDEAPPASFNPIGHKPGDFEMPTRSEFAYSDARITAFMKHIHISFTV